LVHRLPKEVDPTGEEQENHHGKQTAFYFEHRIPEEIDVQSDAAVVDKDVVLLLLFLFAGQILALLRQGLPVASGIVVQIQSIQSFGLVSAVLKRIEHTENIEFIEVVGFGFQIQNNGFYGYTFQILTREFDLHFKFLFVEWELVDVFQKVEIQSFDYAPERQFHAYFLAVHLKVFLHGQILPKVVGLLVDANVGCVKHFLQFLHGG